MEIVTSWMEEGLQQGMQQKAREDILEVLEARFSTVPYTVTERLKQMEDLARLKVLLRQACTAASSGEFQRSLEIPGP